MNNTERIVRVMVFYKINIFKEIIFRALHDLLPDYVLNITQVDSTEQALAAVADNNVDVFFTEFNYLLNHKEWSAEVSSRFTSLCKTHHVRRVLLVPELPYGLLKKVLEMKFELTISQQDELTELKKGITRVAHGGRANTVDLFVAQAGNAVRFPGALHPLGQRVGGAPSYRGRIFNDGDCPSSKPFGQYHCDAEAQCDEKAESFQPQRTD